MNAERILFYAIFFMVLLCFFLLMIIFSVKAKLKMAECKCDALARRRGADHRSGNWDCVEQGTT